MAIEVKTDPAQRVGSDLSNAPEVAQRDYRGEYLVQAEKRGWEFRYEGSTRTDSPQSANSPTPQNGGWQFRYEGSRRTDTTAEGPPATPSQPEESQSAPTGKGQWKFRYEGATKVE